MGNVEMRERMAGLLKELKPLAEASERNDEQDARIDAILQEVNDLGPKIEREANIAAAAQRSADYSEPVSRIAAINAAREEVAGPDRRSIGRRFTDSDQYKAGLRGGRGIVAPVQFDGLLSRGGADDMEQRAVIYSGTAPASMLLPQVLPTVYRGMERPLVMRDVLLNIRTTSDSVTVMQEDTYTNNAAETAEATSTSTGAKPESAITFTEASFPVRIIAHWIPITRQMLEDIPAMEAYVNERLLVGLARREDTQFISGNGTAPNLTGILSTSGIQDLNAAYWTANPVANAGASNENYNRILRAKTKIAVTGQAQASFIVANPTDIENWLTYTDGQRQYLVGGGPTGPGTGSVWGLPIVASDNITAGTALVGDGTMAAVVDREDATIYTTDSHSDFFVRNLFVLLAEERVALAVFRPAAFAKVALA
jgi:HK97 family phage major capsid protein